MSNKLLKNIIKEEIKKAIENNNLLITKESLLNPLTIPQSLRETKLMEGYFKTYNINTVYKWLTKRYGECAKVYIINNEKIFRIITGDSDYNQNIIDKDMALCGYYLSYSKKENGCRDLQYEPRFQENKINDIIYEKKVIYHLTQLDNIEKILKIGLTPKTKNKMFNYPERIYFFLNKPSKTICKELIKQFYIYNKKRDFSLLEINTDFFNKKIDFFFDPNAEKCVYTKENIIPSSIKIIDKISI